MLHLSLLKTMILMGGLSSTSFVTSAELVLVVNKNNPTSILSRSQVIDLYMGKYVAFPDGTKAVPVDIEDDLETRTKFYDSLVGMPLARVNAYWSKVKFSGRARPPTEQKDEKAILDFVMQTEDAIAYIHESSVTADVKVVYRFDE
ncbi:MAG: ABC-type phosphate transport system substrate-binding protein [Arenicella sp.]|jgi:ABC-type phosphate transport system substrate-binding protein